MRLLVPLLVACSGGTEVDSDTALEIPLLEGPTVTHTPPEGPFVEGQGVAFAATATDEDGVDAMDLFTRVEGELPYRITPMEPDEDGVFRADLPGDQVLGPGLEYYLRAFDRSDFRVPADFPPDGPADPIRLDVDVIPLPVPYIQGFDDTLSAFGIYEVGWTEHALGFRGVRWGVDTDGGLAGEDGPTGAAVHEEGFPEVEPVDDWLVGPVLDFSGLSSAEVRFSQYGEHVDRIGRHSLMVALGETDPESGAFTEVLELEDPPEGAWARHPVIDLSAYAGEPRVVLAWRYEGSWSDVWALDGVEVRAFGPDLQLVEVDHPPLSPGFEGFVDVTVRNVGAATDGPVLLTGTVAAGDGGFRTPADLGVLAAGQQVTASLDLFVDAGFPDNTLLAATLEASDGVEGSTWPVELLVGDPTRGLFRLQTTSQGLVFVTVGTGNPLQPLVEESVFAGSLPAGVHSFEVDLAEHLAYLPSEPGRLRWWARVETSAPGNLVAWGIDFDGAVTWTDVVGPFPTNTETLFYLPGRAEPRLVAGVSDPDPLAPGATGTVTLTLRNDGGTTTGRTFARFRAGDPALTLLDDDATLAGPSGWAGGESIAVAIPVQIDPGHTDSRPLPLEITIVDELEAFELEADLPVPWPDVGVGAPVVQDPNGNADGVLDPGEQVTLRFEIRNDGALATQALGCTLAQTGGPAATILQGDYSVGVLDPGAARGATFAVTASSGAVGDELFWRVTCEDGVVSGSGDHAVSIGGGGWVPLPLDPVGDALPGSPMDLREGRWRVDGDQLRLELTAADPVDVATVQLELWALSAGSAWQNHLVTVSGGNAQVFGEQFGGFTLLGDVGLTAVDADTFELALHIPTLELAVNELAFGVGTGFCPGGSLYCDHWPDDWGDPYSGPINTQIWHLLVW